MTTAPRIPSGEQVSYYSSWETDTWLCRCGWTGTGKEASSEAFSALLQLDDIVKEFGLVKKESDA